MSALRRAAGVLLAAAALSLAFLVAALAGWSPQLPGLRVEPLTAALALLATGVGAVVAMYAARNLEGQHRLRRFAVLEVAVVLSLAAVALASNLVVLLLAWLVASAAMAALVAHAGTQQAVGAARTVRRHLLVGDAVLAAAVAAAALLLGTVDIAELPAAAAGAPVAAAVVAVLVVVAGAVRSSLVPSHGWLPETAAAPSPVSALLHAGFVNGLGLLALLLWPLVGASWPARAAALALGLVTIVVATAQHRVRPDMKGRLASSTSSQMGYLAVQVGIGLPVGVLLHLVGHGLWKAAHFLGAGSAVERVRTAPQARAVRGRAAAALAAAAAVGLVLTASAVPIGGLPSLLEAPATLLPVVAAAAALVAAAVALVRRYSGSAAGALLVLGLAGAAYLVLLRVLDAATAAWWGGTPAGWGAPGWLPVAVAVLGAVVVGAVLVAVDRTSSAGRAPGLARRAARSTLPRRPARRPAPVLMGAPAVGQRDLVPLALDVAVTAVAPSWPLHAFVGSSPLAGMERLGFDGATAAARAAGAARSGISGAHLRAALEAGRVTRASVADAVAEATGIGAATVAQRPEGGAVSELDVAVAALLLDPAPTTDRPESRAEQEVRELLSHYCARVYADTAWRTGDLGVWASLRADADALDRITGVRGAGRAVAALPAEPGDALAALLAPVDRRRWVAVLTQALVRDPGWPAHLAWRQLVGLLAHGTAAYTDLLAARFALSALLGAAPGNHADGESDLPAPSYAAGAPDVREVLAACGLADDEHVAARAAAVVARVHGHGAEQLRLAAWERDYRLPVLAALSARARALSATGSMLLDPHAAAEESGPDAQVVTCIDVRSERLRRHLELVGPWETLGAAGFFGLPFTHVDPDGTRTERLPALLRPAHLVRETAAAGSARLALREAVHGIEAVACAPFALAEAAGWVVGPAAALRTLAPRLHAGLDRFQRRRPRVLHVLRDDDGIDGFALDELADAAAAFLRTTGLDPLAPLVVLLGHEAHAANNPHVAAYQCGACGGHAGDVSARALATALNDPRVRDALLARGIEVRPGTWFVAGVHDTTRDRVVLVRDDVPVQHSAVLDRLEHDLALASDGVAHERGALLPRSATGGRARLRRSLEVRAVDWAQVRPEWSLARNAAIVIGPRALTAGLDLDGRVFLQSYRPDADADGSALEFLLTAPLVVAQWINAQYWCSTVDPDRYGAGDKTTHNTIAATGLGPAPLTAVVTGARGDLRIGLPWQAVSTTAPGTQGWGGTLPFHEPLRLLAVVCADPGLVESVLDRHPEVGGLVLGGWIDLVVVDPRTGLLLRRDGAAGWTEAEADAVPGAPLVPRS